MSQGRLHGSKASAPEPCRCVSLGNVHPPDLRSIHPALTPPAYDHGSTRVTALEKVPSSLVYDPSSRRLWTALREIDRYLTSQSAWLVNYAERHRAGLRVGTSITEGTANFLVNRRMNKSQQMRWSRRGADLLLQVRCAALNGKLGSAFGQLFEAEVDPITDMGMAA